MCAVFADTSSEITNFAKPAELDPSLKFNLKVVPPPFILNSTYDVAIGDDIFNSGRYCS